MAMELKIISPEENGFVKEIKFNHEELKAEISAQLEKYQGLVYTDETIGEAKQDRAKLNKFKQALDAKRKEIKAQCLAPYDAFEKQVKELVALVDRPALAIDAQVKAYEEKKRTDKRGQIVTFWEAQESKVKSLIALDAFFDVRWLNAGYAMGKIETEIIEFLARVESELALIRELETEFEEQVVRVYLREFNVARAMAENKALLTAKAQCEEYRREIDKAAAQAKAQEEERQMASADQRAAPKQAEPEPEPAQDVQPQPAAQVELRVVDFRVWATSEQLAGLKGYLNGNGIKFGPVTNK